MVRLTKYFALALAAALSFAACEKPEQSQDEGKTEEKPVELQIFENLVQANADGGEYNFTYLLENGDIDDLKVKCSNSWVHDFDCSEEGIVYFTIDANESESSRITQVTLSLGKVSDKIVISQSGVTVEPVETTFDISYEINGPYVRMFVTPTPEKTRYYAWYFSKKTMDESLAMSPGVDITMYLNRIVEVDISEAIYYGSYAGYSAEQAVAEITLVGSSYQDFELNGETEFYGFACAVSNSGERLSNVTITEFKTGPVAPSANVLTVTADDVNTDRITYSIHTSNMDQYAALVLPAAEVEGKTDAEIVATYNSMSNYVGYLHFGDYTGTTLVGAEDTDYYILAFGFEYGMATTEIQRLKVHTLKSDPDTLPEFSISIDKVTHYRIKGSIEVSPKTSLYYIDWCYTGDDPEGLKQLVRETAQWYVDNGYYNSLAACMKVVGTKGSKQVEYTGLEPNESYQIFAIGIDERTGEFNTDVFFSEAINTPDKKVSSSYIDIKYDKFFDGHDLATAFPDEFADAREWAVVPLEVTEHGDVVDYYYDIYVGDVAADPEATDDVLILDLVQYGNHNTPLTMSYCYFYEDLTLVYFSKDSEDNNSEVKKIKLKLDPFNCNPVSDFTYGITPLAKSPRKLSR